MYFLVIIYQQKLSGMFDQKFNLRNKDFNGYVTNVGEVFTDLKMYIHTTKDKLVVGAWHEPRSIINR